MKIASTTTVSRVNREKQIAGASSQTGESDSEPAVSDTVEFTGSSRKSLPWGEMGKSALVGSVLASAPAVVSALAGPSAGFATATGLALAVGVASRNPLKGIGTLVLGSYATRFGQGGLGVALGFSGVATAGIAASPLYLPHYLEAALPQRN